MTLKGSYSATGGGGGGGDPYLTNGVAVTGISGATSSNQYWRITHAGRQDADGHDQRRHRRRGPLHPLRRRPTTSTYSCRPYLTGNTETCTTSSTQAGDYYVMLRGYQTFSGVRLIASY